VKVTGSSEYNSSDNSTVSIKRSGPS